MPDNALAPEPVNVRERGYAHGDQFGFWHDLTREPTPELRWPYSVDVFDRMRHQDAQVGSVLRAVTAPIIRTAWAVDGSGGVDPDVTAFVARNLGLPIHGQSPGDNPEASLRSRDRFSWTQHLRLALVFLSHGHQAFEQVYRQDEGTGLLMLRKLGHRPSHTIAKINVARDGGLVSLEQHALGMNRGATLPVSRLVMYTLEREGGNWLGKSLLRTAYKNWLLKDRALRTWSLSIDRQGMGLPVYTGAENESDLAAGKAIATEARAGSNAGAALPHGASLDLVGVSGSLPDPDKFVRYQDEQIARAVLAHFLNLGTQTGSWALGTTFADFFTLSLQAVAEEIRSTATAHVIEDLVDVNFGPDVPAPRLVFDEIGSRVSELDRVREAAGLASDADLTKFLRQHSNPSEAA